MQNLFEVVSDLCNQILLGECRNSTSKESGIALLIVCKDWYFKIVKGL